ncbi:MAG: hypothetical protein WCC06_01830 [Candidatus Aminicenantales bacterium]
MMAEESKEKPKTEAEWREKLDRELAFWRESLHKENLMLERMLASFEALEKKIIQKKADSPNNEGSLTNK